MIDPIKVSAYSDKILEIIDNQDILTSGDLQGAIEAIVINIMTECEQGKK